MASHRGTPRPRNHRRRRQIRPSLLPLDERVVPSLTFPGIAGITFDTSGDTFVSYNSTTRDSGQQQSVAEVAADGYLASASVFSTTGASAFPGALYSVGSSASLPSISSGDILELQPNGQLFEFSPVSGTSSQYDDLPLDSVSASSVYDVQTGAVVNLTSQISLTGATYGDFGVSDNSLVVSAESNNWDFVMTVTYGSSGGVARVLVASPVSGGLSASPGGVAVDSQGTILTTLPYLPKGSTTAIDAPVGFNIAFDPGVSPAPTIPTLGLTSVPNIDSAGITVDSEDNFILAVTNSSLYGGGPGIVHINSALTAFLADPTSDAEEIPAGITYQNVDGTNYLAFTDAASDTYTLGGELPLFSGQVSPAQLRSAYGVNQINFTGPGGTTVTGDGSGQTIAIVEEGVDPTLEADLATFDQFYGIAAPPSFQIVDQNGVTTQNVNIVGEASLDVEWAHAIAPGASIVIYDAAYEPDNATASFQNLMAAMQEASKLPGVSVVSLSYGEPEPSIAGSGLSEQSFDSDFTTPGVTFVAASGDSGIYGNGGDSVAVNYPAASPNVLSVGGTSIVIDAAGDYPGTGPSGEVAWGDGTQSGISGGGGGGLSTIEPEPTYQSGVVPTSIDPDDARAVPDVAMDSGAAQEYDVFTSTLSGSSDSASAVGWLGDAGTSAAAPIWAGLIAIADQGRALAGGTPLTGYTQTLPALYSLASTDFHDIIYGNNGDPALPGYDLASGLGTPVANLLVPALAGYELPSQLTIKTEPPASVVADTRFGLTVQVDDSLGNPVSGGTVTVALASNPGNATLGGTFTEPVTDGIATFSNLTLSEPGTGYTLSVTDSTIAGAQTTSAISVTPNTSAVATDLVVTASPAAPVFGQTVTLDATVTASSGAVPIGTLTFEQGGTQLGMATLTDGAAQFSMTPAAAGAETITIVYSGAGDDQATSTQISLTVSKATPTITWADPGNITVGTPLGDGQLGAVATFDGKPLPGVFNYTPAAGTVLPLGDGQQLSVTFTPTDDTDFQSVTFSVPINVVPQPTPTIVISEQPVFQRKLNKTGKPVGKPVLTGFTLDFNMPLTAAAVSDSENYELDTVTVKKVGRSLDRVLHPTKKFTVSYDDASDSVTIKLTAAQTFPSGGQITILSGVTSDSDGVLSGATTFTITSGGKKVEPA
jgi:Bacterial Ig-like domain (group 3)